MSALKSWDYRYEADSEAASFFDEWFRRVYRNTFDEITELSDTMAVLWPESWRLIDWLENDPENLFFDKLETEAIERSEDMISLSFEEMVETMVKRRESNESLQWSQFRTKSVNHLARLPAFSVSGLETGGHGDVINAINGSFGPSWRMIVELDPNGINAFGVYPGGQSGEPGSPYYKTGLDSWEKGNYFSLHFAKSLDDFTDESILFKENFIK